MACGFIKSPENHWRQSSTRSKKTGQRRSCLLIPLCAMLVVAGPTAGQAPSPATPRTSARSQPLPPSQSASHIVTLAPWRAHLIACEPAVIDPVEACFDDAGRLWVVEMRDYPFAVEDRHHGMIRVLSDSDGDGHYDQSQVFADRLNMPTGLALWRDGVVVTLAGELVFLRDTDQDGVADERQQWLTGFAIDNEQLRGNHPRLGPDGWWYIANGLRGGKIQLGSHFTDSPGPPLDLGRRDVRFDPSQGLIAPVSGPAQFGLTFDLLASRIFCSNRNPAVQVVFEQEDVKDNPLAGIIPTTVDVLPPGEHSRVFPLVDAWTTSNLHGGQFTAACGVFVTAATMDERMSSAIAEVFGDDWAALPQWIFVCEPTGSLVKRATMVRRTTALHWLDSEQNDTWEWLASRDPWFRPVNIDIAPDGSILVVDMHRAVIEHPQWVPEELKHRPDQRWGDKAGRLYVVADSSSPSEERNSATLSSPTFVNGSATEVPASFAATIADLSARPLRHRDDQELLHLLRQGNPWLNQTIRRLLMERNATATVPMLLALANDSAVPLVSRIIAMETALLLSVDLPTEITALLDESVPPVLRTATLARLRRHPSVTKFAAPLGDTSTPSQGPPRTDRDAAPAPVALQRAIARCAGGDGAEQFEALLLLQRIAAHHSIRGWLDGEELWTEVARLVVQRGDPWLLAAAVGALHDELPTVAWTWWQQLPAPAWQRPEMQRQVPLIADRLFRAMLAGPPDTQRLPAIDLLTRIAGRCEDRALTSLQRSVAMAFWCAWHDVQPEQALAWEPIAQLVGLAQAALEAEVANEEPSGDAKSATEQIQAIRLIAAIDRADLWENIARLIDGAPPHSVWQAALESYHRRHPQAAAQLVVQRFSPWSPLRQRTALPILLSHPQSRQRLLAALESKELTPRQVGIDTLRQLKKISSSAAQDIEQWIASMRADDRPTVVRRYQQALAWPGDAVAGQQVFAKNCASCHRIGELGHAVGPDISDSRTQTPAQLLVAILDPNAAIDAAYFRYTVLTDDDRIVEGLLAEETPQTIVLLQQDGQRLLLGREEVVELRSTGVSLMPEGLEAQIDPQQMADLIAFIKGWRYLDGRLPGATK
ncbi:MAG: hypothetical protein KatS3mg111_0877 [Pirellulaceae bacterium]|nr:MAG: hypothetical protein KatS3mg111_0877 [Pirellulaceae bacterium]